MKMNEVIIKNANLSPNLNKFIENFTEMSISLLVDYFSKYNNFLSHAEFRNIITIIILLNLLRQTTLLQGAINSIVQCQRALIIILERNLFHNARVYIDNIMIREFKIKYNNEKAFLEVR